MDNNELILNVSHLKVRYVTRDGTVNAVNDVNLRLKRQRCMGLVGETGAGKTSTALAIMNLIASPPGVVEADAIEVNGRDILHSSEKELDSIRGKEVAMIFQDPMTSLNPVFTIGEQIAESIELHEDVTAKEAAKMAGDMLELVGIPRERANNFPHQLSGGMKQRVVIAIALCCHPGLLIADEPTTALDVTIQAQVLALIDGLRQRENTSMLLITHDFGIVAQMCDDVSVMYAGQIVESGSLKEVFTQTLHPYTEGLFNSLPNVKQRGMKLKPIPGLMPNPMKLPDGCVFAPRCSYATEACTKTRPEFRKAGEGEGTHYIACLRYDEPGFHIERGCENV